MQRGDLLRDVEDAPADSAGSARAAAACSKLLLRVHHGVDAFIWLTR